MLCDGSGKEMRRSLDSLLTQRDSWGTVMCCEDLIFVFSSVK